MIHWTPEGQSLTSGLNIYINFSLKMFWFRLVWIKYKNYILTSYYFRFRSFASPHFILNRGSCNVGEKYLFDSRKVVLTREEYLDLKDLKSK